MWLYSCGSQRTPHGRHISLSAVHLIWTKNYSTGLNGHTILRNQNDAVSFKYRGQFLLLCQNRRLSMICCDIVKNKTKAGSAKSKAGLLLSSIAVIYGRFLFPGNGMILPLSCGMSRCASRCGLRFWLFFRLGFARNSAGSVSMTHTRQSETATARAALSDRSKTAATAAAMAAIKTAMQRRFFEMRRKTDAFFDLFFIRHSGSRTAFLFS